MILDRVTDVVTHGWGRVEIVVRDGKITAISGQKSWVRERWSKDKA